MNILKVAAISDRFLSQDSDFPGRVLKMSAILSLFLLVFSVSFWSLAITVGLAFGMAISFGLMRSLWWMISAIFPAVVSDNTKNRGKRVKLNLIFFNVSKYILISGALFYLMRYVPINLIAFVVGISFVQMVMVSKIVSVLLVNYLNKAIRVDVEKQVSRH